MRGEVEAASSAATYYLRHQHRLTKLRTLRRLPSLQEDPALVSVATTSQCFIHPTRAVASSDAS